MVEETGASSSDAPGDGRSSSIDTPGGRPKGLSAQFQGPELTKYRMLFNGARAGDIGLVRGLLIDGMD
eukprot:1131596-Prymnesium_polylepis.3